MDFMCVCDGNDVGRPTFLRLFYFNRPTRDYFEYAIIPIFFFVGTVTYIYSTRLRIYIVSGEIALNFRRGECFSVGRGALSQTRINR